MWIKIVTLFRMIYVIHLKVILYSNVTVRDLIKGIWELPSTKVLFCSSHFAVYSMFQPNQVIIRHKDYEWPVAKMCIYIYLLVG